MPNIQPITSVKVGNTIHALDKTFTLLSGIGTVAGNANSGSYKSVRWYVSGVEGVTAPYDGMRIAIKIPLAGVGTAGAVLSINGNTDADYHPLAYNVNTVLTTHFPVNSIKIFTYDANQKMDAYLTSNTKVTITGVWKAESNYDSNSNSIGYQVRTNTAIYKNGASTACYRYQLLVETENGLEAFTSTSNQTGTTKTQLFPKYIPNGTIRYYSTTTTVASGANFGATVLWQQYQGINLKYSFNITTITNNSPCYIKMSRNDDGTLSPVYSATSAGHPLVFELPNTNDGYYYTYLGRTYTASGVVYLELELDHPTFYYDSGINVYNGKESEYALEINLKEFTNQQRDFTDAEIATLKDSSKPIKIDGVSGEIDYESVSGFAILYKNINDIWVDIEAAGHGSFDLLTYSTVIVVAGAVLAKFGLQINCNTKVGTIAYCEITTNTRFNNDLPSILDTRQYYAPSLLGAEGEFLISTGNANDPFSYSDIKTLDTTATSAQATNASEAITGSGKITLHKVSKTGNYNDLSNKPTIDNNNQTVKGNGTAFGANAVVNIVGGGSTSVAADTANNKITISSSDTGATSIETTGEGNVVSTANYDSSTRKITLTKGVTALTSHQSIKTLKTDNTTAQTASSGEAISGSGTINLHKISKTGSYNDLLNKPSSLPANGGNSDTVDNYHAEQLLVYAKYKYHDIAAFCNAAVPVYEVSADGSTGWTETTLNKDIFAAKENFSFQVTNTSQMGARFTWKSGIVWSSINYAIIGWTYQATPATVTLKFESSADSGATWTDRGTTTDIKLNSTPALYNFSTPGGDKWFRVSIIQTSKTGSKNISTIKLLTSRWGDQGLGSEYEKPYASDGNKTVRPWSNNEQLLGTSSYKWKEIHGITIYEDGTALTNKYQKILPTTTTEGKVLKSTTTAGTVEWADDTNTTYTVASGDSNGQIKVTPSSGDAYNVNVKGLGSAAYKSTGTASGNVPVLDSNGKLAESVIPAVAITDTYEADSQTAMLALTAQKGDICIRSDLNKSFVLQTTPASTLANWKELKTPTDAVLSVNGQTGAVTLYAADVDAATSTHKHSYTPAGSVSLGSNDTASGGVAYVASVSGTAASGTPTTKYLHKTTANASPNAHTHTVTVSGTTGANSGTKVIAVTGVGANGTESVNYNAIKAVSLSASTTSTDGPAYVSSVSGGSKVEPTTKYMKFNAGTTPPSSATFSGTKTNSLVTAVSVNSQGSVTLSGSRSTSGSGTSARRTLTITGSHSGTTLTVTKGDYTPAGTVSFTAGTAPSMDFNTGTNTDTPYISAVSGGSEVTVTTHYMKVGTTAADTKTVLTGVKATSTAEVAPNAHTHSYGSSTALKTSANSGSAVAAITGLTVNEEQTTGDIKYLEDYAVSGGTVSGTTKYFHPSFSGTAKDTGEPK